MIIFFIVLNIVVILSVQSLFSVDWPMELLSGRLNCYAVIAFSFRSLSMPSLHRDLLAWLISVSSMLTVRCFFYVEELGIFEDG